MQVYNWIKKLPDILYPRRCLLCGAPGLDDRDLCNDCFQALPHNNHPCALCALPLPAGASSGSVCGPCSQQPPAFDHCYAALEYDQLTGPLISRLKFNQRLNHAGLLGKLLCEYLERQQARIPQLLLPVPLHKQRLRERGYNQSLEIARIVGKQFEIPVVPRLCLRTRQTSAQTGLERKDRQKNLRRAFTMNGTVDQTSIAILDDVVTTGTTANELVKLLKRSGAIWVDVWAVARTPTDHR